MFFINLTARLKHKSLLIILFLIINFLTFTKSGPNNKCYVLALEGGGDRGSYQAGVIKGLIDNLPTEKSQYDVVTGISVGAINAAGLSNFQIGKEKDAGNFLVEMWRTLKGYYSIFENWKFGPIQGLLNETGLFNTKPLKNLLSGILSSDKIQRKIIIGATKLENGTYHTWDEIYLKKSTETFISAILASSAVPILFPNIVMNNSSYVDGGVKHNLDISSGINKCFDMGYTVDKIVLDIILCFSKYSLSEIDGKDLHPYQALFRVLDIFLSDISFNEIENIFLNFPKIDMRYLIYPTKNLPFSILPITFSPVDIETMIEIGISDAKDAIKKGENVNFINMLWDYREQRRLKSMGLRK